MSGTENTLSIRRRTLSLALVLLVGFNLLLAGLTWLEADHEVEELFDAQLAQSARILMALVEEAVVRSPGDNLLKSVARNLDEFHTDGFPLPGHKYEAKVSFQVWRDGELLFRSASAPPTPLSLAPPGYATERIGEHLWRAFVLDKPDDQLRLITAERLDVRGELVDNITLTILFIDLAGMLLLAALIGLSIRAGLAPLKSMTDTLSQRHPHNLTPLDFGAIPAELRPMADAINELLGQLKDLLDREKRFLAIASHELRTPLAVIRLHAQNAMLLADGPERNQSLDLLCSRLDRATHMVSQLLTLSRLESDAPAKSAEPLNLLRETREILTELEPLAHDREIDLILTADQHDSWTIRLQPGALATLLNNLLSNAIRHAPPTSEIEVRLASCPPHLRIVVIDHGCGIPADRMPDPGERFFHTDSRPGTGLGLAIVKRVVTRHGGSITFEETPNGGLTVIIDLPAPG